MGSLSWQQQLTLKEYMAKYTEKYMAKYMEEFVEECMVIGGVKHAWPSMQCVSTSVDGFPASML